MDRERGSGDRGGRPALAGTTEVVPLADLVQLLVVNGRTGRLVVDEAGPGELVFREGRVVAARAGAARGRKAFLRLFTREPVRFHWESDAGEDPLDGELPGDVRGLVMEALVHRDEFRRVAPDLPSPGTRLALAGETPAAGRDEARAAVLARLAAGPATVTELLDLPGLPDAALGRAVALLVRESIVRSVP